MVGFAASTDSVSDAGLWLGPRLRESDLETHHGIGMSCTLYRAHSTAIGAISHPLTNAAYGMRFSTGHTMARFYA
jgi:hypothetical protein